MLKDKVPPHNAEAEQAVLGALLLDWDAVTDIVTILRADRFYSLQNRIIYEAMIALAKATRSPLSISLRKTAASKKRAGRLTSPI